LFATGLVAGGALMGVIVAVLTVFFEPTMKSVNLEEGLHGSLGEKGYYFLGVAFFAAMAYVLYRIGRSKHTNLPDELPMEGNVQ
jgi:hypothetical protein